MGSTMTQSRHVRYDKSEGQKFNADTVLMTVTCPTCGVLYAIPESFYRSMKRYRGDRANGWHCVCPFGHEWWYVGQTDEERLREQLDFERRRSGRLAHQLDQTEARRRAQKAATTRARRERDRIAEYIEKGVCPVPGCHRSFKNVRLHMAKVHPDYNAELQHDHS